jgi:hypothetical protein
MKFIATGRLPQVKAALAGAMIFTAAAPVQAAGLTCPVSGAVSGALRPAAQAERSICKRVATPGSRVDRRVCRTRAEWDRENQASSIEAERPVHARPN